LADSCYFRLVRLEGGRSSPLGRVAISFRWRRLSCCSALRWRG